MIRLTSARFFLLLLPVIGSIVSYAADSPPVFQGYPEAPVFTIVPRDEAVKNYPCSRCHQFMKVNPEPRKIRAPHPELKHGAGRFWCLECHNSEDRDTLLAAQQISVDFDNTHQLCGRCHAIQHRDWYFGAHGKRVGHWQGERQIYDCVRCHNPHDPGIQPRQPQPPPSVRSGLERTTGQPEKVESIWERFADDHPTPQEAEHE